MKEAWGYVDPGSGYVFLQGISFLWGIILSLFALFFLPFKFLFRKFKKILWIITILVIILTVIILIWRFTMNKAIEKKKVIILGIDAMDAKITQQLMQEGRLSNFSYLKTNGTFSLLKTTNPSESVVAWSSFVTCLNPGGHGIFDFIMRDPKTYFPYLSFDEVSIGPDKPNIQIRRKGEAFWDTLYKNKIHAQIYFCPNTFPPGKVLGQMVSGMGVPDVLGMAGKFSFYTTKSLFPEDETSRGRIVQVFSEKNIILTYFYGPKLSLRGLVTESKVPLRIVTMPEKDEIAIRFQGNQFLLKKNSWSNWQKVYFKIGPFKKVYGIVRFYLKNIEPNFELYCSPINFDPQKPLFPISYPDSLSKDLAKKIGLFYTQGMPHDTWALTENRLNDDAFLKHADLILEEKKRIMEEGLNRFREGVFFFYFDVLDPIQHMFWRYIDPKSPSYEANAHYKNTIFEYYEKIDRILGDILKRIDKDTTLIVLSDHGFNSFRRAVHLNRWLLENGFLFLKEGRYEGREFFEDIDWLKTKAYALGFGGIYINRIGRERNGVVNKAEEGDLKKQIRDKLIGWRDPASGENAIKEVYFAEKIFSGPYTKDAPDLFVGFNSGYRTSWQTALGGVPKLLIEDNKKKWSGDHLVDPSLVPGVLFINKKMKLYNPGITNISNEVMNLFRVSNPKINREEIFR